jgi:glycosyltransferase involved in cell wall biosynthesis
MFLGVRSDVPDLLTAMDVLLLPSFYEGLPNAVIEAQATGLRCVVSDAVTKDVDITGLVDFLPLDAGAALWAERLLTYAEEYERPDMSAAFIEKGYDISAVVKKFTELCFY